MSDTNPPDGEYATLDFTKEELIDQLISLSLIMLVIKETSPVQATAPPEFNIFDGLRQRVLKVLRMKYSNEEIRAMLRTQENNTHAQHWMGNLALAMALLKSYTKTSRKKFEDSGITNQAQVKEAMVKDMMEYVQKNVEVQDGLIGAMDEMRAEGKSISEILMEVDEIAEQDSPVTDMIDSLMASLGMSKLGETPPPGKEPSEELAKVLEAIKKVLPPGANVKATILPGGKLPPGLADLISGGTENDLLKNLFGKQQPQNPAPKPRGGGLSGEVDDFLQS